MNGVSVYLGLARLVAGVFAHWMWKKKEKQKKNDISNRNRREIKRAIEKEVETNVEDDVFRWRRVSPPGRPRFFFLFDSSLFFSSCFLLFFFGFSFLSSFSLLFVFLCVRRHWTRGPLDLGKLSFSVDCSLLPRFLALFFIHFDSYRHVFSDFSYFLKANILIISLYGSCLPSFSVMPFLGFHWMWCYALTRFKSVSLDWT